MAKTRAQRKAERRKRQAQLERQRQRGGDGQAQPDAAEAERRRAAVEEESRAQHDTQLGVSGEVAEAEAAIETGTTPEDLEAPAPSRADVPPPAAEPPTAPDAGAPTAEPEVAPEPAAPEKPSRRERRRARREEERRKREAQAHREAAKEPPAEERRRGAVTGFLASCWAELRRVQWPDRDTLIQASAVTLVFVAIAAAYLGALDALFNFLIKRII